MIEQDRRRAACASAWMSGQRDNYIQKDIQTRTAMMILYISFEWKNEEEEDTQFAYLWSMQLLADL